MATPRVNAAVARVGESVYVIGGSMVMIENNAHPTAIVEQYTPQIDQPSDKQPPKITVLSPKDQAYLPNLTVEFTTNKPIGSIQLGIDGKSLISVSGNTSISLQQGKHNLTVYAVDYFGNIGASDTVTFTVSETIDTPFPLSIVAAVGFLFLVAGIVLVWVFFGRKKEKTSEREG
jgi:hypothetical protein